MRFGVHLPVVVETPRDHPDDDARDLARLRTLAA